jgi:hypothetical protein
MVWQSHGGQSKTAEPFGARPLCFMRGHLAARHDVGPESGHLDDDAGARGQTASFSSFEARKATFFEALILI